MSSDSRGSNPPLNIKKDTFSKMSASMQALLKPSDTFFLESVPLFQNLEPLLLTKLSTELSTRVYNHNDYIIRKGETGRAMFFIVKGTVEIVSEDGETTIDVVSEGSFFGEIGLLFSVPRTASCRTKGRVVIIVLTKQKLTDILKDFPVSANTIRRIGEERYQSYMARVNAHAREDTFGKEFQMSVTSEELRKVSMFRECKGAFLHQLAMTMETVHFYENQWVCQKGDVANEMYFVVSGSAAIIHQGTLIVSFEQGSFFGEVGLFFNVPRTVSILTTSQTLIVLKLKKSDLDNLIDECPEITDTIKSEASKRFEYNQMRNRANSIPVVETELEVIRDRLKNIPFLAKLPLGLLNDLSLLIKLQNYVKDDIIIQKDEPGDSMHFLIQGVGHVVNSLTDGEQHTLAELVAPTFFGEVALFFDVPRTASVIARTSTRTFILTKVALLSVLEKYPELKDTLYEKAKENYARFLDRRKKSLVSEPNGYDTDVITKKIQNIPTFQGCDERFVRDLSLYTTFRLYNKDEFIVRKGDVADAMYFVISGNVKIISEDHVHIFALINSGQFFGEIGALHGIHRTASVQVNSDTAHLFIVTTKAIHQVAKEYPDTYKAIVLEAEMRLCIAKERERVELNSEKKGLGFDVCLQDFSVSDKCIKRVDSFEKDMSGTKVLSKSENGLNVLDSSEENISGIKEVRQKRGFLNRMQNEMKKIIHPSKLSLSKPSGERRASYNGNIISKEFQMQLNSAKACKITDYDLEKFIILTSGMELREKIALRLVCKKWDTFLRERRAWTTLNFESIANARHNKQMIAFCGMVGSFLVHLNLSNCWRVVDEDLLMISQYCNGIEILNVSNCWKITDMGLAAVSKTMHHIIVLDLSFCSKITAATLEEHEFSGLLELNLSFCKGVHGSTLEKIFGRAPFLRTLKFRRCNKASEYAIFAIAKFCKHLNYLDVSDCDQINDNCLKWISTGCTKLKYLNLTFCSKITNQGVAELRNKLRRLQFLSLNFCFLLDDNVGILLSSMDQLENISLRGCRKITDRVAIPLVKLKRLKTLDLSQCSKISGQAPLMLSFCSK